MADEITRDQVRELLADCDGVELPAGDDDPLVIDSYSTTWILHQLEERFGRVVGFEAVVGSASVSELHAVVNSPAETQSRP